MVTGRCLCGTVQWRAEGPFSPLNHCHCSRCRKAQAAPFATFTSCARDAFEWVAGEEAITRYASSENFVRPFCSRCGSTVPQVTSSGDRMRLPAGSMNQPTGLDAGRHIFAASKVDWHTLGGPEESYDAYPPGMEGVTPLADTPRAADTEQRTGSCLCGKVRYVLSAPFSVVHNCHCSLCRRARGAAHATNGFVPIDSMQFTDGDDTITTFTLPGRGYGQAFCATCGSGLPRKNTQRGIVNVPLGSLDDAPGRMPDDHIFVGSIADWYRIRDMIPQYEEFPA